MRLACLISGGGRTLLNLANRITDGTLECSIELVIASRPGVGGIERARQCGFEPRIAHASEQGSVDAAHDAMMRWVEEADVDLVCLCGWLRKVRMDAPLKGRTINIHPALLPDFGGPGMYGERVHRAVLAAGRSFSGCTVHFVDDQYDHGPIILQRACPVRPGDDVPALAARVFEQECIAYPQAIRLIAAGRVRLEGERVVIAPTTEAG